MTAFKILIKMPGAVKFDVESEKENIDGFISVTGDILSHERFLEMKQYHHHKLIDCHFHSVFVSYITYKVTKSLSLNYIDATRAALLHDFYLYDWHITKHDELHAWYHPKAAKRNAEKYFGQLTPMQTDMILSHMWPLHIIPPKSSEGMALTFADKLCSNLDLAKMSDKFLPIYNEINDIIEGRQTEC